MSFWTDKSLDELSQSEWESLCDGCGLCCLEKIEDADTGDIFYTNTACCYLDPLSLQCRIYSLRHKRNPQCLTMTPDTPGNVEWLPETCSYRLVYYGLPLPEWHHLISGDPLLVDKKGFSARSFLSFSGL